jgi:hypothetical protein
VAVAAQRFRGGSLVCAVVAVTAEKKRRTRKSREAHLERNDEDIGISP